MNHLPLLVDLQALLETNSAGVKVYREESVPESANAELGYIVWDLTIETYDKCSGNYTAQVFGQFEVILYSDSRSVLSTLITSMLDLLAPETAGFRDEFTPSTLTSTHIHFCTLESSDEIFPEKTGHNTKDVLGVSYSFNIKASI